MKTKWWGAVALAIIILGTAPALAPAAEPAEPEPRVALRPVNRDSAEHLNNLQEKRLQEGEVKRAEEEKKQREQEQKAKMDKIQRKTGRTPTSWQVLNR
jgi:hypothetical protein